MVIHHLNRLKSYVGKIQKSLSISFPCDFVYALFALICTTGRLGMCGFQLVFFQMQFWPYTGELVWGKHSRSTVLPQGLLRGPKEL